MDDIYFRFFVSNVKRLIYLIIARVKIKRFSDKIHIFSSHFLNMGWQLKVVFVWFCIFALFCLRSSINGTQRALLFNNSYFILTLWIYVYNGTFSGCLYKSIAPVQGRMDDSTVCCLTTSDYPSIFVCRYMCIYASYSIRFDSFRCDTIPVLEFCTAHECRDIFCCCWLLYMFCIVFIFHFITDTLKIFEKYSILFVDVSEQVNQDVR